MSKDRIVCWVEPRQNDATIRCEATVLDCVKMQRHAGESKGHTYELFSEALDDFMAIHQAWFKETENE